MSEETTTTISLTHDTKGRLARLGVKGETYEQILNRLIENETKKK